MQFLRRKPGSTKVGGTLTCSWCDSTNLKLVDSYPPDRDVYRCRECGQKLTYIRTPMTVDEPLRIGHPSEHPYRHLGARIVTKIPILGKLKNIPIIGKTNLSNTRNTTEPIGGKK